MQNCDSKEVTLPLRSLRILDFQWSPGPMKPDNDSAEKQSKNLSAFSKIYPNHNFLRISSITCWTTYSASCILLISVLYSKYTTKNLYFTHLIVTLIYINQKLPKYSVLKCSISSFFIIQILVSVLRFRDWKGRGISEKILKWVSN